MGDEYGEEAFEGGQQSTIKKVQRKSNCRSRLEELAKPRRWCILGTWRDYKDVFEEERMKVFKEKVQEEFSMTPEETELYFLQLRSHTRRLQNKKAIEKQLRRDKAEAKHEAHKIFKKLLKKSMRFAFKHPPPPIVSPMIRNISDIILEQLCEIHRTDIPKREDTDKNAQFLIALADWTAIIVSNIYYEINVDEKDELDQINEVERIAGDRDSAEGTEEPVVKEEPESDIEQYLNTTDYEGAPMMGEDGFE